MTTRFNTHDIVIDRDGYKGRIYNALNETTYDVVFEGGHNVRHESELTLVRKYVDDSFAKQCEDYLAHQKALPEYKQLETKGNLK